MLGMDANAMRTDGIGTQRSAHHSCEICRQSFDSRNKLFKHIAKNHHSSYVIHDLKSSLPSGAPDSAGDGSSASPVTDKIHGEPKELRVLYQDKHFLVLIKPQGMPTMGGGSSRSGGGDRTVKMTQRRHQVLSSDLLDIPIDERDHPSYAKALPCHRLDAPTGGLLVCSKSRASETVIKGFFRYKITKKVYRALVVGRIEIPEGEIDRPISGRRAVSRYRVIESTKSLQYGWLTTLDLMPQTGRRHQLRRHLQEIGHPIVGDQRYSTSKFWPREIDELFLWATQISFPYPMSETAKQALEEAAPTAGHDDNHDDDDDDDVLPISTAFALRDTVDPPEVPPTATTKNDEENLFSISIPEPTYFETFRQLHLHQYEASRHTV
jgi:23S rRNA-/tRNA-specific pseudouridylate synthase